MGKLEVGGGEVDGRMMAERPERCQDQQRERSDHGKARDVVNPFADGEAPNSGERQQGEHAGKKAENDEVVFRNPGGARADHVSELAGDLKQNRGDGGECVGPDVPGAEKAGCVAQRAAGSNTEAPPRPTPATYA